MCVGVPRIKLTYKWVTKLKIKVELKDPKYCVDIPGIGDLLEAFEKAISSIPGVGFLWDMLNDMGKTFASFTSVNIHDFVVRLTLLFCYQL